MRAHHLFIAMILASALVSCNGGGEKDQQTLYEVSKQDLVKALNERDQLLSLVNEVSSGLNEIKKLENIMTISAGQLAENPAKKTQILSDIARLKTRIQQRKAQLNDLEAKLSKSTINNKNLQETIDGLRTQIDSQIEEIESLKQQLTDANAHIGVLNSRVDSLNTAVNTIAGERNAAQEASARHHEVSVRLGNELNLCYYSVASKSELKKHNIIESGFLRKTRLMNGDFDKGFFTISDKRILKSLPLNAKKAKILTNHPASSYQLFELNGKKILNIKNPEEFWSLTNYLVVQID